MDYVSPGGAFSSVFGHAIDQENAAKRQAALDSLNQRRVEAEIEQGQAALQEKRQEHQDKLDDQARKDTITDVGALAVGDVPDADLIARSKKYHVPLRTNAETTPAPVQTPIPQEFGQTAVDTEGPKTTTRFAGSPKQMEEKKVRDRVDAIIAKLPELDPSTPEAKKLAIEYEMTTGKSLPAGIFKSSTDTEGAVMRQNPKTGKVDRLTPSGWVEWNTDVPKGAHWMTEPDTSARDAAKTAATDRALTAAQDKAYTEFDTWAKPIQGHLDGIRELGVMLNAKTPQADTLIAPLVLKATISGQGSGFRMTRAEIENVVGGRSKWESLKAALNKWSLDPSKALQINDDQREEMRSLAKEIRNRATTLSRKITDARHEVVDATDIKKVHQVRADLQAALAEPDDEENGGGTGASGSTDTRTHYDVVNGKLVPRGKQ